MNLLKMDLGDIADLANEVALNGAIRLAVDWSDDMFEYIVGVAVVVYQSGS